MSFYYDPLDSACKSVLGAIPRSSELSLHLYTNREGGEFSFSAQTCTLVLWKNGEEAKFFPMEREENCFSLRLCFHATGLYFYHFELDGARFMCGKLRRGAFDGKNDWQITVFDEDYTTPDWFKGGVMYQIFPDRFFKGEGDHPLAEGRYLRTDWGGMPSFRPNEMGKILNNDFFGGNLNGVREKLKYLKDLGVTVIYFNPIFEAFSNHRYDTGDYMKIDPLLGTEEEFDRLVKEAENDGIRIILDGVFNHTGDDSKYFNKYGKYPTLGAYQSKESPYADWYTFKEFPMLYECWWGILILPEVNEASPSYQEYIMGENGVLKHWLRHGIGGYRLDVADELPDFFLKKLRETVKSEDPDAILIGEVWEDASNKISYDVRREYLQGYELDSVMNYPLKDGIINFVRTGMTYLLRETIAMLLDNYPKQTLDCLMNILGSHDTPRILTVFGGEECDDKEKMAVLRMSNEEREKAKELLKMAAVLQFTLPGVPCVFYGDEAGMEGYQDPFCRRCFPWDNIDGELHGFYQKLGKLRTGTLREIFAEGSYREIFADTGCIVYQRKIGQKSVVVYVNRSSCEYNLKFAGEWKELLSEKIFDGKISISACSYGILTQYYV